jgi:hypothetical protein
MEGFKKCSRSDCGRGLLPLSEFKFHARSKDGYGYYCRVCILRVGKERYHQKRDEVIAYQNSKRVSKMCSICGKEFLTRGKKVTTCSRKCASTIANKTWWANRLNSQEYIDKCLWSKINKAGEDDCWEWQGHRDLKGYGTLIFFGKRVLAHRVICKLTHEDFDEGLLACHKCDNPPCCNPNHLYPGTYKDNSNDKHQRGRANISKGENNGRAKITAAQVIELRNLFAGGMTKGALATKYGLTWSTVDKIVKNQLWKEVA